MSYGLGWVIQDYRGHELVSHGGVIDGFRAHITLMPRDGFALAILSNRHQTRLNLALSNTLVDRLLGLPPRDWNDLFPPAGRPGRNRNERLAAKRDAERQPGPPPHPPADYVGEYEHPAYGRATVELVGEKLRWDWSTFDGDWPTTTAKYLSWQPSMLDDPLIEFRADGGKVTGFVFLNLVFQKRPSRLRSSATPRRRKRSRSDQAFQQVFQLPHFRRHLVGRVRAGRGCPRSTGRW